MKVLTIGMDRKLFEEGSAVLERSKKYAEKMEELHMIVFTKKGFSNKTINNLHIYPTNSLSRLNYIFDAIRLGKKIIVDSKFVRGQSVISTQDPFETGVVGLVLKRKFRLPLQTQIHTDFLSPHFKKSFLNNLRVVLARFVINKSASLRVVSHNIEKSIKNRFPNIKAKIDVLPIFVDVEKISTILSSKDLKATFPQYKLIILMASRLTREKRIDVAILAFKKILKNVPYAGLIIAGDGTEARHLKSMVKELGIENNVQFVGWQNDLISMYKTADIFLLTSEYEGYGMTLIEAGASGCPIVTTKVGIAESPLFKNDENAFICEVGGVDCLSDSVNNLISNNWKRELFTRNMQESVKEGFGTLDDYVSKYVGLLEKLL